MIKQMQVDFQESVREATLRERFKMTVVHTLLISTIFITCYIILNSLLSHIFAGFTAPAMTKAEAMHNATLVILVSLAATFFVTGAVTAITRTPIGYLLFGARIVNDDDMREIGHAKSAFRAFVKTLAVSATPLVAIYFFKREGVRVSDIITRSKVMIFEKTIYIVDEGDDLQLEEELPEETEEGEIPESEESSDVSRIHPA